MVTVIDVLQVENSDGEMFVSLILQGGITMIQSKSSGKFYATSKRTRIASTFDYETAKHMIGEKMFILMKLTPQFLQADPPDKK